jgi:hypothetical protein
MSITQESEVMSWIKAKDRLPPKGVLVLAVTHDAQLVMAECEAQWLWLQDDVAGNQEDRPINGHVIAWQPHPCVLELHQLEEHKWSHLEPEHMGCQCAECGDWGEG